MTKRAHREHRRRLKRKTWGPKLERANNRQIKRFERMMTRLAHQANTAADLMRRMATGGLVIGFLGEDHTRPLMTIIPIDDEGRPNGPASCVPAANVRITMGGTEFVADAIPTGRVVAFDAESVREPIRSVTFIIGYLGDPGPTYGVDHDGEWWPDAHDMRHDLVIEGTAADPLLEPTETVAERRARLDAWIEASGDILDEQPLDPPLNELGLPFDAWYRMARNDVHIFHEERISLTPHDYSEEPIARRARGSVENPVDGCPDDRAETDEVTIPPWTVDGE